MIVKLKLLVLVVNSLLVRSSTSSFCQVWMPDKRNPPDKIILPGSRTWWLREEGSWSAGEMMMMMLMLLMLLVLLMLLLVVVAVMVVVLLLLLLLLLLLFNCCEKVRGWVGTGL